MASGNPTSQQKTGTTVLPWAKKPDPSVRTWHKFLYAISGEKKLLFF